MQYLLPSTRLICKNTCKKPYEGVSVKLNQNSILKMYFGKASGLTSPLQESKNDAYTIVHGKGEKRGKTPQKSNTMYQVILKQPKKPPCFAQLTQELFRIHEQIELV